MKDVYLVNPHRYLTWQMYEAFMPKFAWYSNKPRDMTTTAKGWMKKFTPNTEHEFILLDRDHLNVPFVEGVWERPDDKWYFDPNKLTNINEVMLPSGKVVPIIGGEDEYTPWLRRLSYSLSRDPAVFQPQFNAISCILASRFLDLDIVNLLDLNVSVGSTGEQFLLDNKATMFLGCKSCIFRHKCSYALPSSKECRIPMGAEMREFASFFGSNKSSDIMTGLRMLVQRNAQRLGDAIEAEDIANEGLDKGVTALASQVFTQGLSLAKVLDPTLRGGPKVAINVAGNAQVSATPTASTNPQQFAARAVKELQAAGVDLDRIDQQAILDYMEAKERDDPIAVEHVVDTLRAVTVEGDVI